MYYVEDVFYFISLFLLLKMFLCFLSKYVRDSSKNFCCSCVFSHLNVRCSRSHMCLLHNLYVLSSVFGCMSLGRLMVWARRCRAVFSCAI